MNQCELHNISVKIAAANTVKNINSQFLDGSIEVIDDAEAVTLRAGALYPRDGSAGYHPHRSAADPARCPLHRSLVLHARFLALRVYVPADGDAAAG